MRKHDQVRGNKISKQQLLQQQLLDSVKSYTSQSVQDDEDNNHIGSMFCNGKHIERGLAHILYRSKILNVY